VARNCPMGLTLFRVFSDRGAQLTHARPIRRSLFNFR
jgi:hypothetical protein